MDSGGAPLSRQTLYDPRLVARRSLSVNGWSQDLALRVSTVTQFSGGCTSCFTGRTPRQVMPSARPRQPCRPAVRRESHASDPVEMQSLIVQQILQLHHMRWLVICAGPRRLAASSGQKSRATSQSARLECNFCCHRTQAAKFPTKDLGSNLAAARELWRAYRR